MTKEEIQSGMGKIQWFHRIDLGHGIVTPGPDATPKKLATIGMPENLTGKTVLDIGAWDGFFSFEAERRGAKRVLATDSFVWAGNTWGGKAGFEFARRARDSKVEDRHIDVMDLSPEKVGIFDVVLCLGVLYHMRHPLLCLEKLASVTAPGGMVILETHIEMLQIKRPVMAFYPQGELNGDPSNWCGPNPACVIAMLKAAGFQIALSNNAYPIVSFEDTAQHSKAPKIPRDPEKLSSWRMTFHAWK